ncbi:putative F-box protein At1g32420 [Chenopodium quinoa]|uniref:putative F-box protein At1g32420 n=1 Tax=Chenopodium quinoa TaxID=63459 RepID=UPI000B7715BE|nr:putative F-box protein At1g32420 [Chenopodium quinoa]
MQKMIINLPEELLHQIIIRLPVKSLLRFRCVCKSWCSLISSSNFILSQLHHNQIDENYDVLFRKYLLDLKEEIYSIHTDNEEFQEIETLDFHFKSSSDYFLIIGCVNGLICLWDETPNTLMLWNPSIRKYYTLPVYKRSDRIGFPRSVVRDMCFGFGYDALSNDYKVVRIIFYNMMLDDNTIALRTLVVAFSLRRKLWRRVKYVAPLCLYSRSCNVGGFVYRLTQIDNYGFEIVSFDLSAEKFAELACPEGVKSVIRCKTELTIFRDSLALLHEWDYKRYHIWVMKENGVDKSWMKLFSVDLDGGVPGQRIVGFSMKGLMLVVGEGSLLVSSVTEDVEVVKYVPPEPESAWHVESYKESLVLFNERDSRPF